MCEQKKKVKAVGLECGEGGWASVTCSGLGRSRKWVVPVRRFTVHRGLPCTEVYRAPRFTVHRGSPCTEIRRVPSHLNTNTAQQLEAVGPRTIAIIAKTLLSRDI
jgi:hypothetical protein